MMIPSCVLLAVPVLLLSGCDKEKEKEKEKETFQSFVNGNKLFEFMNEEKRNEVVAGVASRPRELKEMKKEAVRTLKFMTFHFQIPETYDMVKLINFIQEDSELSSLLRQYQSPLPVIMYALMRILSTYLEHLESDPDIFNLDGPLLKDLLRDFMRTHPERSAQLNFLELQMEEISYDAIGLRAYRELLARAQLASQPAPAAAASGEDASPGGRAGLRNSSP